MGDLNINILPDNPHHQCHDYLNMLEFHGLISTINTPTRIANESTSCIDHIMVKTNKQNKSIVYKSTITDHYTTIFTLQSDTTKNRRDQSIVYNNINFDNLKNTIKNKSWQELFQIKNTDDAWRYFVDFLKNELTNNTINLTKKNSKQN